MIKIELVRFEAQDVITSSVPAMPLFPAKPIKPNKPQQPVEPEIPCTCTDSICAFAQTLGPIENLHSGCEATEHTCPKY